MAYNPEKATLNEKWLFRMRELLDYLEHIPFTSTQRVLIDCHLNELRGVFLEAHDQLPLSIQEHTEQTP